MSTKFKNILANSSACLTSESLQKYSTDTLSSKEKRSVEMHLADCEMCSDELEGLILLKNPEKLASIVTGLNTKIDLKTQSNSSFVWLQKLRPYYSAAALILVFISISIFLFLNNFSSTTTEMADSVTQEKVHFTKTPSPKIEKLSEEKSISTDTFISSLIQNEKLLANNSSASKEKKKLEFVVEPSEVNNEVEFSNDLEEYIIRDNENLVASGNSSFVSTKSEITSSETSLTDEIITIELEEEAAEDDFDMAKRFEDTKEDRCLTEPTASESKVSTKRSKSTAGAIAEKNTSNLETALAEFKKKNYQAAIDLINSLKTSQNSEDYYSSLWYKSLSYIELGKPKKAKILLEELSQTKNSYQKKAKRKLKQTN